MPPCAVGATRGDAEVVEPPASAGGGIGAALAWPLGILVLVIGAWLRWTTWHTIPGFFGPGDPAIYFGMGRGILRGGTPVQDFLHHYLTLPPQVLHLEDYYEPAFGYLVAAGMAIGGGSPQAAAGVALAAGVLAIVAVARIARPHGPAAAVVAAAIVALEPWSIYYSGVLMKETVVALATLGVLAIVARLVGGPAPGRSATRDGMLVACACFAAGLLQYESFPLLAFACFVTLLLHDRRLLVPWLGTTVLLVGALALVTGWRFGVPISAKVLYFMGVDPVDPFPVQAIAPHAQRSLLPLGYITTSILQNGYPLLLLLGLRGLFLAGANAIPRTFIVAFVPAYLWLHGVPQDLWNRDFIVLTALLAAPAAAALTAKESWTRPAALGGAAWGAMGFLLLGPPVVALLAAKVPAFSSLESRIQIASLIPLASLVALVFGWLIAWSRAGAWSWVTSLALGLALTVQFAISLPWAAIPLNPQFRDFEIERARRQRVSEWMRTQVPRAPVLAERAEEVAAYSGFPSLIMPQVFRRPAFRALVERYEVRYILAPQGLLPDSALTFVPVELLGEREGYKLWTITAPDTTVTR